MLRLPLAAACAALLVFPLSGQGAYAQDQATRSSSPTVGLGLSIAFGSGGVDTGVGLRVFSGNIRNRAVGSLGLDYMFGSQSLRGTVGVGYLGSNVFGSADLGYNFNQGAIDYGLSIGGAATRSRTRDVSPPVFENGSRFDEF